MNLEYCAVQWDETASPLRIVGKTVLLAGQDAFSAEARVKWEEGMALNVWYCLEEHRILGSANRLRRELYEPK